MPSLRLSAQRSERAVLCSRVVRCVIGLVAVVMLGACPRELAVPDAEGAICDDRNDCNGGATCGALRACVIGRCEGVPSLLVPCDGGMHLDSSIDSSADAHDDDAGE